MATVERVRRLDNTQTHTHTRVATIAPTGQVYYAPPPLFHHQSTKAGVGFYASRRPELGKIACVISAMLPHTRLLFVQRDVPPAEPARGPLAP